MRLDKLVSIGLFTMALVLTIYSWQEYLSSNRVKEGFSGSAEITDLVSDSTIAMISKKNEPVPTQQQAEEAYQTLLRFIRNDFKDGIKYVIDFRQKFYDDKKELRPDLDIRKLMDNYQSPIQRL